MPRPWVSIGTLPVVKTGRRGEVNLVADAVGKDGRPVVALVLLEGREYRLTVARGVCRVDTR